MMHGTMNIKKKRHDACDNILNAGLNFRKIVTTKCD